MKEQVFVLDHDVRIGRFILEKGEKIRIVKSISEEKDEKENDEKDSETDK
jgi:hypothetical protein